MSINDIASIMSFLVGYTAPVAIVISLVRYGAGVILDAISGRGLRL